MTISSQISAIMSDSAVIEHIQKEIKRAPKMKQQTAARVARNLDVLLNDLRRSYDVKMHAVCSEVPLGDPEDRDSKALYKYRNPEGSKPRKYVTKPARYFDIAKAISRIPGHSLTGSIGEVLRSVFDGTPYAPARSSSESVAIRLKMILERNVEKIAHHIDLPSTFQKLARIRLSSQETLHSEDLHQAAILEEKYSLCTPQLELGYIYDFLHDDRGNHLQLKTEKDGTYWLTARRRVSLFIGMDDDSVPRPYVILETEKGLYATHEQESISLNGYRDAPRVAGMIFYSARNERFLLDEDVFLRSVVNPWSEYDSHSTVYHLASEDFYKSDYSLNTDVAFEEYCERFNEFELDDFFEEHRSHAWNDQLADKFLNSNPSFKSKYLEGKAPISFKPISVEILEQIGTNIDSFGSLALGGEGRTLNLPDNTPLLFGDGALGKLMGWFTGSATLSLELGQDLRELVGEDLEASGYKPPYGWYKAHLDPGYWSASDLLWLRTKIFATKIDSLFEATRPQEKQYEQFIEWLGDN